MKPGLYEGSASWSQLFLSARLVGGASICEHICQERAPNPPGITRSLAVLPDPCDRDVRPKPPPSAPGIPTYDRNTEQHSTSSTSRNSWSPLNMHRSTNRNPQPNPPRSRLKTVRLKTSADDDSALHTALHVGDHAACSSSRQQKHLMVVRCR